MISFIAEVKQTRARKLVSNDIEYEVLLRSPDPDLLDLGKLPADRLVKVKITYED